MSALLLDEHPPMPVPLQLVLLTPALECWISDCARPRVDDGVLCARHAPQMGTA